MSKTKDYKNEVLNNLLLSNAKDIRKDKDVELMSAYENMLTAGDYNLSEYFDEYAEPYLDMKEILSADFETRNEHRDLIARYCLQMFRILTGDVNRPEVKSLNTFGDRKDAIKYKEAYENNETIRTKAMFPHKGYFKTFKKPLKEAAWYCVHSYVCTYFLDSDSMVKIIPTNVETFEAWNEYVNSMEDIPDDVRELFIINKESGTCPFQDKVNSK